MAELLEQRRSVMRLVQEFSGSGNDDLLVKVTSDLCVVEYNDLFSSFFLLSVSAAPETVGHALIFFF